MGKWWKKFDFLSIEPKLYIRGKERFQTKFGTIISILTIISIIILTVYFFLDFLDKKTVNVLHSIDTLAYSAVIDLNQKPFFFRIKDISGKIFDRRIAFVTALKFSRIKGKSTYVELETEPCSYENHLERDKNRKYLQTINFTTFTCFNASPLLNLTNDSEQNSQFFINLYISPCKNSPQFTSCYPNQIIRDKLNNSNFYFEYYFPSYSIDHTNYSNPLEETIVIRTF